MLKRTRQFAICFLIASIIASSITAQLHADIEDGTGSPRSASHWVDTFLSSLIAANVVDEQEYDVSEFDVPITRGRFTDLFVRLLGFNRETEAVPEDVASFDDVQPNDDYYLPIRYASALGIVSGYPDNSFRPETPIERQEIFTIIGRVYESGLLSNELSKLAMSPSIEFTDYPAVADYAKPYVMLLAASGIIVGYQDGSIRPADTITCAEAITIVDRIHQAEANALPAPGSTQGNTAKPEPPAIKATATPQPSPIATATPKPSSTSAAQGERGGGGGTNNGQQNNNATDIVNKEPYDYDDTVEADIDSIISLKHISSIIFTATTKTYVPTTPITTGDVVCDDTESMKLAIDALRSLKLWKAEPLPNITFSGGFPLVLTMRYTNGAALDIHYLRHGIFIDGLFYPILWNEEARGFERQLFAATLRRNSGYAVNQLFNFFSQTDPIVTTNNSSKAHELLSLQIGERSADNDKIREQVSLTAAAMFSHDFGGSADNSGYRVYRFKNDYAYGADGSFFSESLSGDDSYWLVKLREHYDNNNFGLRIGKTDAGQWHCDAGAPPDDTALEMYEALEGFLRPHAGVNSAISGNIANSPLGAAIDGLAGDVEDARLVDVNNGALIVYVRVGAEEFGYTLSVSPEFTGLELNRVYSMQDIVNILLP